MLGKLTDSSAVYNAVQFAAGVSIVRRWLAPRLSAMAPGTIVDIGAGTGLFADLVPLPDSYTAVDVDSERLERLAERFPTAKTVVGDATALPFADDAFDFAICLAVAHHLPDVDALLAEVRRVTTRRFLLWEPLKSGRLASRALWAIDQGSWPRTRAQLTDAFSRHFTVEVVADRTIFHRYLLLEGRPRPLS